VRYRTVGRDSFFFADITSISLRVRNRLLASSAAAATWCRTGIEASASFPAFPVASLTG